MPAKLLNHASSHSKKYWVVLTHFWVKCGLTQPLGYILNNIFKPMAGFVHILPEIGLKQSSIF